MWLMLNSAGSEEVNRCFIELLRQPEGVYTQLQRMNRYGLLAALIPEFANIVGRMQYDLFHVYTVDQHTLFVVRNLRRFAYGKYRDRFPYARQVFKRIAKPELLYIAAIFHDIAKGRGRETIPSWEHSTQNNSVTGWNLSRPKLKWSPGW